MRILAETKAGQPIDFLRFNEEKNIDIISG